MLSFLLIKILVWFFDRKIMYLHSGAASVAMATWKEVFLFFLGGGDGVKNGDIINIIERWMIEFTVSKNKNSSLEELV